jgi:glycosyltransferase involved in cell wall biosynthesis
VHNDNGIQLRHLPTIPTKHLDATVHSFVAALHAIVMRYDIVHFHTIGPACFAPLARLSRALLVTTIHRFDYLSGKWGWFARICLRLAERISLRVSHGVITVAPFLQQHYKAQGYRVTYIPNGVTLPSPNIGTAYIQSLGLVPNQYMLFLGRLVPEKRPDWLIRAFQDLRNGTTRLVIAGGSSATAEYVQELKALARPANGRIIFTDAVYGALKEELFANARVFVSPSALEGLPITLLEAMSYSRPCLVSNIPSHCDVIQHGKNGFLYTATNFDQLRQALNKVMHTAPSELTRMGEAARKTVAERYDWEKIVDQIEHFYESLWAPTRSILGVDHILTRKH